MTVPITPVPVRIPATVAIPADGESVNSASVAAYVQTLANAIEYSKLTVDIWHDDLTSPAAHNAIYDGTLTVTELNADDYRGGRLLRYHTVTADATLLATDWDVIAAYGGLASYKTITIDNTNITDGYELTVSNQLQNAADSFTNSLNVTARFGYLGAVGTIVLDYDPGVHYQSVRLMWRGSSTTGFFWIL